MVGSVASKLAKIFAVCHDKLGSLSTDVDVKMIAVRDR